MISVICFYFLQYCRESTSSGWETTEHSYIVCWETEIYTELSSFCHQGCQDEFAAQDLLAKKLHTCTPVDKYWNMF